jgi:hypothetical protein
MSERTVIDWVRRDCTHCSTVLQDWLSNRQQLTIRLEKTPLTRKRRELNYFWFYFTALEENGDSRLMLATSVIFGWLSPFWKMAAIDRNDFAERQTRPSQVLECSVE